MKTQNTESHGTANGVSNSVLALSVVVALLIGLIAGFFFGENRTEAKYENYMNAGIINNNSGNSSNDDSQNGGQNTDPGDVSDYDSIDYTQFRINSNTTVDDYYADGETKFYASNLIGQELPDIKWTDSAGVQHSTSEYAEGRYIVEFFSSTCSFCNSSIPEIAAYRENNDVDILSFAFDSGNIDAFNAYGEHAWYMDNQSSSEVSNFINYVPWIPTLLYIENNVVKLVTYGGVTESDISTAWDVAFSG